MALGAHGNVSGSPGASEESDPNCLSVQAAHEKQSANKHVRRAGVAAWSPSATVFFDSPSLPPCGRNVLCGCRAVTVNPCASSGARPTRARGSAPRSNRGAWIACASIGLTHSCADRRPKGGRQRDPRFVHRCCPRPDRSWSFPRFFVPVPTSLRDKLLRRTRLPKDPLQNDRFKTQHVHSACA